MFNGTHLCIVDHDIIAWKIAILFNDIVQYPWNTSATNMSNVARQETNDLTSHIYVDDRVFICYINDEE
jgi:hypothetical protein